MEVLAVEIINDNVAKLKHLVWVESYARSRITLAWYLISAANALVCVRRLSGDLYTTESSGVVVLEVRRGSSQVY